MIVPKFPQLTSGASMPSIKHRRYKLWTSQLSNMGQVIPIPPAEVSEGSDRWEQFDAMVGITKACILEVLPEYLVTVGTILHVSSLLHCLLSYKCYVLWDWIFLLAH